MQIRSFMMVGLLAIAASISAGQEPKSDDSPDTKKRDLMKAFARAIGESEQAIRSPQGSKVQIVSKWSMSGEDKDRSGSFEIDMLSKGRTQFIIEMRKDKADPPRWTVACNGKAITRSYPSEKMHSITPTDENPLDDLPNDGIVQTALHHAGVDFLARPDMRGSMLAQVVEIDELEAKPEKGQAFALTLANGRHVEIHFRPEEPVLPILVKSVVRIPYEEKKSLTIHVDTRLQWELAPTIAPNAFQLKIPSDSEQVENLQESLLEKGTTRVLGQEASAVKFTKLDGGTFELQEWKGKSIIVVYAWATWCAPSIDAIPAIEKFRDTYTAKGVRFLSVNAGDTVEKIQDYVRESGYKANIVRDPKGEALAALHAKGVPSVLIIGKDGTIQARHLAGKPDTREKLSQDLDRLLKGESLVPKK